MADQQRFEGPSIEEVLAEVRATLGPDAEIIEANKIRSGGIGGFFAKETFEVLAARASTVAGGALGGGGLPAGFDADAFDRATAAVLGTADDTPTSLMDLADRISDAEQTGAPMPADTQRETAQPTAGTGHQPRSRAEAVAQQAMHDHLRRTATDQPGERSSDTPPHGLAEGATPARRAAQDVAHVYHAVEAGSGFEPMAADELPRLSTEAPAFTEVMQRIAADAGPDATNALDHRIAAAMAARRAAEHDEEVGDTPDSQIPDVDAHQALAVRDPDVRAVERAVIDVAATSPHQLDTHELDTSSIDRQEADGQAAEALLPSDRTARLLSWLERDNLPRTTLMTALRSLPQMPALPETSGIVVAVVGERRAALKMCKLLAKACDADPADVVLASRTYTGSAMPESQRIIDVTDAGRERLSWRRRPRPTFVAVESPPALRGDVHEWTRGIVDALEAHQVIGVVAASRKVEDVARWVELVGGVDGLALMSLGETTTPYAVLALEIPVAYLDEVVASASTWAQALLEGAPA